MQKRFFFNMLPIKLSLSFVLKACVAIFVHLYKFDILNLRAEKSSSLDSNISAFIVASCVACLFSKIDLSPHFQTISNTMVYVLELMMTLYGTELTMYMIWIPLMKGLLWMSSKISKTFTRSRYKSPADDMSNCIESNLFCYLNICLALFIASNTLASFDCFKNLKSLWPPKLMLNKSAIMADTLAEDVPDKDVTTKVLNNSMMPDSQVEDVTTEFINNTNMANAAKVNVNKVRPKKRPVLLLNVR